MYPRTRGFRAIATALVAVATGVVVTQIPLTSAGAVKADGTLPPGQINHIVLIELENEGFQATFGPGSAANYVNHVLRPRGELIDNYYATGHNSLDNYISQVSGQSPAVQTQNDCLANGAAFADLTPGSPSSNGQVVGQGCVYPASVPTLTTQLDTKFPPNRTTHVASWRGYEEDMGNIPNRDGGVADPSGGTDCGHPSIGQPAAIAAVAQDQYATRHNPFVWFHSIIDNSGLCAANDVPLGTLNTAGTPAKTGHLVRDFSRVSTDPASPSSPPTSATMAMTRAAPG